MAVPVAYIEQTEGGWRAIQYIKTKRCIISMSKKRESLVRFLTQNGYRVISQEEQPSS